ncbi:MAG: carbon-nitrogen hydrolase family protein [Alphaproteobacteria bacterium]|nr:carbon-nitrogen hydrolase family protein [Alphaproteobacteria bacterium]MDE2042153.1 carbon-nitrogen hydrolase family protein [Alphaproteobacteria bacterium]MDE2340789.1 carbon-nitrogen hydrolase family protein [Alphaproteobacteria bacterium]
MKIAVAQTCTGIEPVRNAEMLVSAVAVAAASGAAMLFTPEMSGLLDSNRARARIHICAEADDPVIAAVRQAAAQQHIWVHLGSTPVLADSNDGRLANRALMIDDTGMIRARYDKMHLFDVDLQTGESWRESAAYVGGMGPRLAETPLGKIGLSICYDLRFPALYQAYSAAGADLLAIPAAFTVPTGRAHWLTLLKARAIENECFVIAAAQAGTHEDGRETYGHSLVIDPWGEVLLDMGEGTDVGFAALDMARLADIRTRIPVLAHRRNIPHI